MIAPVSLPHKSATFRPYFFAGLLCAVCLLGEALPAAAQRVSAGPDAFLHYQVESTDALLAALQDEPALRQRYARHFGVSEGRVVDFVRNALIPYRLPADRKVTTYGVTASGHIYPVHQRLRKGTRVWATRSGLPVLKWACANPLTKTLPGTKIARKPTPVPIKLPSAPVVFTPPEELALLEFPGETPPTEVAAPLLATPTLVDLSGVTQSPVSPAPALALRGGGGGANFAPFLLPLVFALTTSGGGSDDHKGAGGAAVVPEPGTLALWGAAGLPFFVVTRRRHRRK